VTPDLDVAIVGAGVAGLTAAAALRDRGLRVLVLEKSRGLGGRAATRRRGDLRIDHGAQFFTARDARFQARVDTWLATGDVAVWTRGIHVWDPDAGLTAPAPDAHPRYAPPAGMSALGRLLGDGIDVRRGASVARVTRLERGWRLVLSDGSAVDARAALLTPPAPQTRALLADAPLDAGVDEALATIAFEPCFAVLAGYEGAAPQPWPGVRVEGHPDLAWVAHDGSRRARRDGGATVLVVHATPAFTRTHFDAPHDAVADALLRAATDLVPWADRPAWRDVHRWRYARPIATHAQRCLTAAPGLIVAGDAFGSDRVEGAFLSGVAAAEALHERPA
jgi:renalase